MVERISKLIVTLTLLLFLLQAVIGVFARAFEEVMHESLSALGRAGGLFTQAVVALIVACFAIGMMARGVQLITNRDPRAARERATRDRAVRRRARRPSEGVPLESHAEVLDDPDPAIGDEERGQ